MTAARSAPPCSSGRRRRGVGQRQPEHRPVAGNAAGSAVSWMRLVTMPVSPSTRTRRSPAESAIQIDPPATAIALGRPPISVEPIRERSIGFRCRIVPFVWTTQMPARVATTPAASSTPTRTRTLYEIAQFDSCFCRSTLQQMLEAV